MVMGEDLWGRTDDNFGGRDFIPANLSTEGWDSGGILS